jgi:hypothetical protein
MPSAVKDVTRLELSDGILTLENYSIVCIKAKHTPTLLPSHPTHRYLLRRNQDILTDIHKNSYSNFIYKTPKV